MPGVPSGRGCEACRKQKKKCDQRTPSCSRCIRLAIECKGVGQRRFKFVQERSSSHGSSRRPSPHQSRSPSVRSDHAAKALSRTPSNESTMLVRALIQKLNAPDDLRYHLTWTYGSFLEEIPRHMGVNEALDASVEVLVTAHSQLCSPSSISASLQTLTSYNHALNTLRVTLGDPIKARQPETLCACYLLLISQSYLDLDTGFLSGHGEGATQIIKARGLFNAQDEFESYLLLSLRGPVLVEAMINERVSFSRDEWSTLVESHLDGGTKEGLMMKCWARMPDLMRRGKEAINAAGDRSLLVAEASNLHETLTGILDAFRARLLNSHNVQPVGPYLSTKARVHAYFLKMYGLILALCMVSSCILNALKPGDSTLDTEAAELCQQILVHAEEGQPYRPLGSGHVMICLIAAWSRSTDFVMQAALEDVMIDYAGDFPRQQRPAGRRECLEFMSRRLNLRND